jgi:hypothetical protein
MFYGWRKKSRTLWFKTDTALTAWTPPALLPITSKAMANNFKQIRKRKPQLAG